MASTPRAGRRHDLWLGWLWRRLNSTHVSDPCLRPGGRGAVFPPCPQSSIAGVENELYYRDNTLMLFGDAKAMMGDIVKHLTGEAAAA